MENFDENFEENFEKEKEVKLKIKVHSFKNFKNMIKGYKSLNKETMKCTYLIMLLGLGYEFFSNRALSNRVNELQGKVDNLYKQASEMKNGNKALEKK